MSVVPTITSVVGGNASAAITFTAASIPGDTVQYYGYQVSTSTDFSGAINIEFAPRDASSLTQTATQFWDGAAFVPLSNGTTYYFKVLAAFASAGWGGASPASSGVQLGLPSAPSSLVVTKGNQSGSIAYTAGSDGGSAITNYQYSTDGTNFTAFSPAQTSNPLILSGLTNGTTYTVYLKAVNAVGVSPASTASNSFVPSTTPSAPTSLVATPQNGGASIAFTAGSDGSSAITNYKYSTDGTVYTAFSPTQTTSPVTITGLNNGTAYTIYLKAVNANGDGTASSSVAVTPQTTPDVPTSLVATGGNQSISVAFTGGNGGAAIDNYQYSTDAGATFRSFTPAQTTSPVSITTLSGDGVTTLTNGTLYTVQLKAHNANGYSAASASVSATPSTTPSAPTSLVATSGNAQVSIAFTPGNSGGLTITNYKYSLDGTNYTAFSPAQTTSPVTITGLTNGTSYTIYLKQVNANGDSPASSPVSATPGAVPSAPTSLSAVDTYNGTIAVSFTPGSNGGWAITNYQYSLDGGSSFSSFSPAQTTSPVTISGLSNRTNYTIQLRALNVVGTGAASASLPLYYMCFLEGTEILCHSEGNSDEYRKIEDLRKGDLVKTFMDGYKAIDTIGFTKVYNPGNAMRSKNRLYKCTPAKYPGVTKDLFITGCHSVLVEELTAEQEKRLLEEQGKIYITDNHYRLMACVDERAEPYTEEGLYTVWHLALENDNYYYNYGIFANGLHVETTSKRMIKEQSGMTLKE